MAVDTGHGTTVAWGTTTALNALNVMSVTIGGYSLGDVNTSKMSTTGTRTYMPSDLIEGGEFTIVYQYDPAVDITLIQTAETCTIDWGGTGNTSACSAYRKSVDWGATSDSGELMTVNVVCKAAGAWTHAG